MARNSSAAHASQSFSVLVGRHPSSYPLSALVTDLKEVRKTPVQIPDPRRISQRVQKRSKSCTHVDAKMRSVCTGSPPHHCTPSPERDTGVGTGESRAPRAWPALAMDSLSSYQVYSPVFAKK